MENIEHNQLKQENLAQIQLAGLLFPETDNPTDAMLEYTSHPKKPSEQFRTILENNSELKERVDTGDEGAIRDVADMIEL